MYRPVDLLLSEASARSMTMLRAAVEYAAAPTPMRTWAATSVPMPLAEKARKAPAAVTSMPRATKGLRPQRSTIIPAEPGQGQRAVPHQGPDDQQLR
ncbi:MAG TPA: hypothetical protein VGL40_12020 [Bacillota bacterium]